MVSANSLAMGWRDIGRLESKRVQREMTLQELLSDGEEYDETPRWNEAISLAML